MVIDLDLLGGGRHLDFSSKCLAFRRDSGKTLVMYVDQDLSRSNRNPDLSGRNPGPGKDLSSRDLHRKFGMET